MNNLKFKYARAKNIVCFGENGIELNFEDYGNIICVRGVNKDLPANDDDPASNATGKSSLQEIISIGLYGKTVKYPKKNGISEILNTVTEGDGEIEILVDDLRILRQYRRKSKSQKLQIWQSPVHIWDDSTEITKGKSTTDTQKWLEGYIGLDHHAFCTVCVFDDRNTYSFLEASTAEMKRQIVESLLGLDKYREYGKAAKDILKEAKTQVIELSKAYELLNGELELCDRRINKVKENEDNWILTKKREMQGYMERLSKKQAELSSTDVGDEIVAYQRAQERTEQLTEEIAILNGKREKIVSVLVDAKERLEKAEEGKGNLRAEVEEHGLALKRLEKEIRDSQQLINKLQNLENGAVCPTCHSIIDHANYTSVLNHEHQQAQRIAAKIDNEQVLFQTAKEKFGTREVNISRMRSGIQDAEAKLSIIDSTVSKHRKEIAALASVEKPSAGTKEKVLEAEIVEIKKQLKACKEEFDNGSPYKEIMENAIEEKAEKQNQVANKKVEIAEAEKEIPYYEYWVKAFGDNGIRKFVIDGVVPALNSRVAHWMQVLVDGQIQLSFDNTLEETISRRGNPSRYSTSCNSERRRINLATSQAFAYVMMLNSGKCPNIVFLDEVTGGAIDRSGIIGIYNMIFELAKERKVFVTTHNEILIQLLQGCETLNLCKENDITVLVS
jgi:DNA repair exonuclease SbcCD ATPase subunit